MSYKARDGLYHTVFTCSFATTIVATHVTLNHGFPSIWLSGPGERGLHRLNEAYSLRIEPSTSRKGDLNHSTEPSTHNLISRHKLVSLT